MKKYAVFVVCILTLLFVTLSSAGATIASFILAPPMRGVGQIPTVSLPAKIDYVVLQLELESDDYPSVVRYK